MKSILTYRVQESHCSFKLYLWAGSYNLKLEDLILSWKLHLEVWSYTLMLEATHEANTSSLLYHVYKSFYWKKKKWSSCFCCHFFLNKLFSRYLETYFDAFAVTWWTNYFPPGNSILKGVKWGKVELRWHKRIVLNSCSNFIIVLKKTFSLFLSSVNLFISSWDDVVITHLTVLLSYMHCSTPGQFPLQVMWFRKPHLIPALPPTRQSPILDDASRPTRSISFVWMSRR